MNSQPANRTIELRQLDPRTIELFRQGSNLCLTVDRQSSFERVSVVRAFPLTDPDRYWSVHDCGDQEIGLIVEPAALDPAVRRLLTEELERRYFAPVIQCILSVQEQRGNLEWLVETDRGRSVFSTRPLREVILQPVPFRYIISDLEGNRYDVKNLNALDKKSQLLLMAYL